jgi:hypothetical protein
MLNNATMMCWGTNVLVRVNTNDAPPISDTSYDVDFSMCCLLYSQHFIGELLTAAKEFP